MPKTLFLLIFYFALGSIKSRERHYFCGKIGKIFFSMVLWYCYCCCYNGNCLFS